MASLVLGLVSGIVHTVTGRSQHAAHPTADYYASPQGPVCTCHTVAGPSYCPACAAAGSLAASEAFHPATRRERKFERRAARHARKAARWSQGRYPTYTPAVAPQHVVHHHHHPGPPYAPQREQQQQGVTSQRRAMPDTERRVERDYTYEQPPPEYEELPARSRPAENPAGSKGKAY